MSIALTVIFWGLRHTRKFFIHKRGKQKSINKYVSSSKQHLKVTYDNPQFGVPASPVHGGH